MASDSTEGEAVVYEKAEALFLKILKEDDGLRREWLEYLDYLIKHGSSMVNIRDEWRRIMAEVHTECVKDEEDFGPITP